MEKKSGKNEVDLDNLPITHLLYFHILSNDKSITITVCYTANKCRRGGWQ